MRYSNDYHDYVFKDGIFVGKFEEMYQNVEDPWCLGDANAIYYDMMLYLLNHYKICKHEKSTVLDIGCGKGAFTAKLKKGLAPDAKITGIDIAHTAIKQANEKYGGNGIDFTVCNITEEYNQLPVPLNGLDLVVMSEVMWYILTDFEKICNGIKRYLKDDGYLIINQVFYTPEKQKYGKQIVSCVEDMLKLVSFGLCELIEVNRFKDHHAICLFKKG